MFDQDLSALPTRGLLEEAANCRALASGADARLLECAQTYADRYHPSVSPARRVRRACDGGEKAIVLGGDGCPEITEFAIAEFAVVVGVSPGVGRQLVADAQALRYRFPQTWARILAGEATPWKARQIVQACHKLDHAAAAYVDQRVAAHVDSLPPSRLTRIMNAAKKHADPANAADEAGEAADQRGVFVGSARGDGHGNRTVYIKAAAAAVSRFDTAVADIADALRTLGDTRTAQHRRAAAIEILADPTFTLELLHQAGNASAENDANSNEPARPHHPGHPDPSPPNSMSTPAPTPNTNRPPSEAAGGSDVAGWDCLVEPVGPLDDLWLEASGPDDPDPLTDPYDEQSQSCAAPFAGESGDDSALDPAAQRAFVARIAQIKQDAHTNPSVATQPARPGTSRDRDPDAVPEADRTTPRKQHRRPGKTEVVVHLTDHTLATGGGVLRAESIGPLLASQLTELIGFGPYVVKPVIDLNDAVSVDAYEIPTRIRDRVKLMYPVELFPYGTRESSDTIDLDHLEPYDPHGPTGQTSTDNLAPLGRFGHRVKTHAIGWDVRRIDHRTVEWTTPHGFTYHVDPEGTHRRTPPAS